MEKIDEWYCAVIYMMEVSIPLVCTQRNICVKVTKGKRALPVISCCTKGTLTPGIKKPPFIYRLWGILTIWMYATLVGICSIQYIIMWCLALMENQWRDKPTTAATIQKQFPNWHMEGLCDWFWLLLDFNTVRCQLIDSQTSSCGLSTNCQMSPCLLFLLSHLFLSPSFFGSSSPAQSGEE